MMPFFLYNHRDNKKQQILDYVIWISVYAAIYIIFIDIFYGVLQFATLFSLPLLMVYLEEYYMEIFHWYFNAKIIFTRSVY